METNVIYNEDCLETMNKLDEKSIDVILTSPPYNTSRKGSSLSKPCANIRYDDFDDCRTNEEYIEWTINIFNQYNKVLRKDGVILYNLSYSSENTELIWIVISEIIKRTVFTVADNIIWKKPSTSPNSCSSNKLTRICEYVFVICRKSEFSTFFCNKKVTSLRKTGQKAFENIFNLIAAKNNDENCDIHKATYSSELCCKLLKIYAPKNGIIYDSFLGTGTTAIACIENGNRYIGSEISQLYCDYAEKRINNKLSQPKLF